MSKRRQFDIEISGISLSSTQTRHDLEELKYERNRVKSPKAPSSSSSSTSGNPIEDPSSPELVTFPHKRPRKAVVPLTSSIGTFSPRYVQKTDSEVAFLVRTLSRSFIFSSLEYNALTSIISTFYSKTFPAGSNVLHKDQESIELYVIKNGKVKIDIDENTYEEVGPGKVLGEISLLHNSPQIIEATAVDECECWVLDRDTYVHMVKKNNTDGRAKFRRVFKRIFETLSEENIDNLIDGCKFEVYCTGEIIVKKGANSGKLWVFYEGKVSSFKTDSYDYIWETDVKESIVAESTVKSLSLLPETGKRILGDDFITK